MLKCQTLINANVKSPTHRNPWKHLTYVHSILELCNKPTTRAADYVHSTMYTLGQLVLAAIISAKALRFAGSVYITDLDVIVSY